MERAGKNLLFIFNACVIFTVANGFTLKNIIGKGSFLWFCVAWLLVICVIPNFFHFRLSTGKLQNCANGCELLWLFLLSTSASILYSAAGFFGKLPMIAADSGAAFLAGITKAPVMWLVNSLIIFLVELVVFWDGMIRIYISSEQLGIRWRVIGAVCGMIPVVHLVVLIVMIRIVEREISFENDKILRFQSLQEEQICHTRYPVLLVHGVFFRDFRYFNYWGRIPKELEKNGAQIFYGNHQSAASVAGSAQELTDRILQIVQQTGCEKVNIIAHSKGGLDCRYAISRLGAAPYVASLTTINTPHRGCEFADYLLSKIGKSQQDVVAKTYNAALRKLGDPDPDFLAAVYDLTAENCRKMNEEILDVPGIYYQSVGSKLNAPSGGRFPLNFSYRLVNYFDGSNDGLVGEKSFPWGEEYQFLSIKGSRGISHGDMIDLNRENFDGFDVREYYVQLVSRLREKGF